MTDDVTEAPTYDEPLTDTPETETETAPPAETIPPRDTTVGAVMNALDMAKFAEVGAGIRLRELAQERALILRTFPNLNHDLAESEAPRLRFAESDVPFRPLPAARPRSARPKRKRTSPEAPPMPKRTMSAAARKQISKRMKIYWKTRRAE